MSTIGGNFTAAQVNQQFQVRIQRGDAPETQTAMANTGTLGDIAKESTDDEGGVRLSKDAMQTLGGEQQKEVAEHAPELAQKSGMAQTNDRNEQDGIQRKRTAEREQAGETPEGYVSVSSPKGTKQLLTLEEHEVLQSMDRPEAAEEDILGDVPESNLKAAAALVKSQVTQGVSKVANLKTDPAVAEAAAQFERKIAEFLEGSLDIRQPGNDKLSLPMQLEQPDAGDSQLQEQLFEEATEISKDWEDAKQSLTASGASPIKAEMTLHGSISQIQSRDKLSSGGPLELAVCQALKDGALRTLEGRRRFDKDLSALMDKLTPPGGNVDAEALEGELQLKLANARKLCNPLQMGPLTETSRAASLLGHTLKFEQIYRQLQASGLDMSQIATALTATRRKNLERVSNAAWEVLDNAEIWKSAGLTPEDLKGVQDRAAAQTAKMAKPDSPTHGEASCIAMADQIAALAGQRADTNKATLTTQQAQALKGLQVSGNQYVETRGALLLL